MPASMAATSVSKKRSSGPLIAATASASNAARSSCINRMRASENTQEKEKIESFRLDHEAFYQAFEKPTQIYRMLRQRMLSSPYFLQRNLSYISRRKPTSTHSRKDFKVDSILDKIINLKEQREQVENVRFYNLFLTNFVDGNNWAAGTVAKIDVYVGRVNAGRRKDIKTSFAKTFEGKMELPLGSTDEKHPVLSIPKDCFKTVNGCKVRSFQLIFKITIPKSQLVSSPTANNNNDSNVKNDNLIESMNCDEKVHPLPGAMKSISSNCAGAATDDGMEPPRKRSRSVTSYDRENIQKMRCMRRNSSCGSGNLEDCKSDVIAYFGQVIIWNKDIQEGLIDCDYELALKKSSTYSRKANAPINLAAFQDREFSWVELDENQPKVQMYNNKYPPMLSSGPLAKIYFSIQASRTEETDKVATKVTKNGSPSLRSIDEEESQKPLRIVYHFYYNNCHHQTETRDELICPWCSLTCLHLYSLLKHLRLCHSRFKFLYEKLEIGARIYVSVNEKYDGSYSGSPYDLAGKNSVNFTFGKCGPRKRNPCQLAVYFPRTPASWNLDEFLTYDVKDGDLGGIYKNGHNRLYHHTTTCLPINPNEIEIDSEGEPDPEWLREKTVLMIDEFTDVNEGEKEIMKLWNTHVMKFNYVGDCQIPAACTTFVERHGEEVIRKNIYRNFILHLTNLFEFGLLSSSEVYSISQKLQSKAKELIPVLKKSWEDTIYKKKRESTFDYLNNLGIIKCENANQILSNKVSVVCEKLKDGAIMSKGEKV